MRHNQQNEQNFCGWENPHQKRFEDYILPSNWKRLKPSEKVSLKRNLQLESAKTI